MRYLLYWLDAASQRLWGVCPLEENFNNFCLSCTLEFTSHLQFVIGSTLDTIWFQSCLLQILCNQVVLVINTFNLTSDRKPSAAWFCQTDWTVISDHIWWIIFFVHYLWWARNTKMCVCSYLCVNVHAGSGVKSICIPTIMFFASRSVEKKHFMGERGHTLPLMIWNIHSFYQLNITSATICMYYTFSNNFEHCSVYIAFFCIFNWKSRSCLDLRENKE